MKIAERYTPAGFLLAINGTALGVVADARAVGRARRNAGPLLGGNGDIELARYVAWLIRDRERRTHKRAAGYEDNKAKTAARAREIARRASDIGAIAEPANWARRLSCRSDFRLFCETYLAKIFYKPWSPDHVRIMGTIQRIVFEGGLLAIAMPRSKGKTALLTAGCLWAISYRWKRYIFTVAADKTAAERIIGTLRMIVETMEGYGEDFPEVCRPIRALEGVAQRTAHQTCEGVQTNLVLTESQIILSAAVPAWAERAGGVANSAVMEAAGITGRIRGANYVTPAGEMIRPDLALIDDPQTEESARSQLQSRERWQIITKAVLGLGEMGVPITAFAAVTVIHRGDLADTLVDRKKSPEWQGERTKILYEFPKATTLWERYAELRRIGQESGAGTDGASAYYKKHRAKMDAGAVVAWEGIRQPRDLSALQTAMNFFIDRPEAFWSEWQQEPQTEDTDERQLTADEIALRVNGFGRGIVPDEVTALTAFIDVQKRLLYWMVVGWTPEFSGFVVEYGTEPEQRDTYFTAGTARKTLSMLQRGAGLEAYVLSGLERLSERIIGKEWPREDGGKMRVDRSFVDARWGDTTDIVKRFCRVSRFAPHILPYMGFYYGSASVPMAERKLKAGGRRGIGWMIPYPERGSARVCQADANYWKTFARERFRVAIGDAGALSLFGRAGLAHAMLIEHVTNEFSELKEGKTRTVEEWKLRVGKKENHYWDCLVGNCVAASVSGCTLAGLAPVRSRAGAKSYAEWYAARRQ